MTHILTRPERLRRIRSIHIAALVERMPADPVRRGGGMNFAALRERECSYILCAKLFDPAESRAKGGGYSYCSAECKAAARAMRQEEQKRATEERRRMGGRGQSRVRGPGRMERRLRKKFGDRWFTRAEALELLKVARQTWDAAVTDLGIEHRLGVRDGRGGMRHEYRMPEGGEG